MARAETVIIVIVALILVGLAATFFISFLALSRCRLARRSGAQSGLLSILRLDANNNRQPAHSTSQSLLQRTVTSGSGMDQSLHEEIESMLPEPSNDSGLMLRMREVQGIMLELDRLTTGHPIPFQDEVVRQARIHELHHRLSQLSSPDRKEVETPR